MLYARYKAATETFINWVLDAAKIPKKGRSSRSSFPLEVLREAVDTILRGTESVGRSFCSDACWSGLPKALSDAETAILLRKETMELHYKDGDPGHVYFIKCLEDWMNNLQGMLMKYSDSSSGVYDNLKSHSRSNQRDDSVGFDDIYAVLREFDPDIETGENADEGDVLADLSLFSTASGKKSSADAAGASFHAAAFEEDMDFFFICAYYDLEELVRLVSKAWQDYKLEKCSHMTAVIVTGSAIKMAKQIESSIQLTFPSVKDGEAFYFMVDKTLRSSGHFEGLIANIQSKAGSGSGSNLIAECAPGMLLLEMMATIGNLRSFTTAIPAEGMIHLREGYFGPTYEEDKMPLREVMQTDAQRFLFQELPGLYNFYAASDRSLKWTQIHLKSSGGSLPDEFLELLTTYFSTKTISIGLVFAVICWLRIVFFIQGDGFLKKTVYLAEKQTLQLHERLTRCLDEGLLRRDDTQLATLVELLKKMIESVDMKHLVGFCRTNPYLAGACVLDRQLFCMQIGCQSLMVTSRFRAFGHVYHAMRDRKLIDPVPFCDHLLKVYDQLIFYPSPPVFGDFFDTFMLSSHITALGLRDMKRGLQSRTASEGGVRTRRRMDAKDLSLIYRMLQEQNFDVFYEAQQKQETTSQQHVLEFIYAAAQYEQQDSCVLLLDILALNDTITKFYKEIHEELHLEDKSAEFYRDPPFPGADPEWLRKYELEHCLTNPFMLQLDAVNEQGKFDLSLFAIKAREITPLKEVATLLERATASASSSASSSSTATATALAPGDGIVSEFDHFADVVAWTIKDTFDLMSSKIKEGIFFYHSRGSVNTLVSEEFGYGSSTMRRGDDAAMFQSWGAIMEMLDNVPVGGELDRSSRKDVKKAVRRYPGMVGQVDPYEELGSLLHHAAGGNAPDYDLTHWLACKDALQYSKLFLDGRGGKHAVHLAIEKNQLRIVIMLVEVDCNGCLNVPVPATEDRPIHIAMRAGYKDIAMYLREKGCDLNALNKQGQSILDVATPALRSEFREHASQQLLAAQRARAYRPRSSAELNADVPIKQRQLDEGLAQQMNEAARNSYGRHRNIRPAGSRGAAAPPPTVVTAADEARAAQAAAELMEMLDLEDEQEAGKKSTGGGGSKKKGGSKKNKKKK